LVYMSADISDMCEKNMRDASDCFAEFLHSSKKTILLITITVVSTLIISSIISMRLSKVTNLNARTQAP